MDTGTNQLLCDVEDGVAIIVSGMGGGGPAPTVESAIRQLQEGQEALTLRLVELSKPTIAVLPGPAAGAGLSIALACDLRIAAESAFAATAFGTIGRRSRHSWKSASLCSTERNRTMPVEHCGR